MAEEKKTIKPDKPKLKAAPKPKPEPKTEPTEDQIAATEERDKYAKLESLKSSEGGKVLIAGLEQDIEGVINKLTSEYSTLTHVQLIALCIDLKNKKGILMTLLNASENKAVYEEDLKEMEKE